MRLTIKVALLGIFLLFVGCKKENLIAPEPYYVIVEDTWYGNLNGALLIMTLIEGRFEGSVTIGGTAHITIDERTVSYLISGSHNRTDTLVLDLYKIDVNRWYDFREYHLKGRMTRASPESAVRHLEGAFRQLDRQGGTIRSGTWQARRGYDY